VAFLRGCDRIVHGGDIGTSEVLAQLSAIAPVSAVRGNNDKGPWAEALPETELFGAGPRRFRLPVAVAEVLVAGGQITARVVEL
jgi:predicted phosphodiesterase